MTPEECRAYADKQAPRVLEDGWTINAKHVAIEQSLRTMHGHPSYIADLDGPGRYRPRPTLDELVRLAATMQHPPPAPECVEVAPDVLEAMQARATHASSAAPSWSPPTVGTLYGIPIEVDEHLAPGQWRIVLARGRGT